VKKLVCQLVDDHRGLACIVKPRVHVDAPPIAGAMVRSGHGPILQADTQIECDALEHRQERTAIPLRHYRRLRQGLAFGLAHIEHIYYLVADHLASLLLVILFLALGNCLRAGRKDWNAPFALAHVSSQLHPRVVASHVRCIGAMNPDGHCVVQAIPVEPGQKPEILRHLLGGLGVFSLGRELLDPGLDLVHELTSLHDYVTSFRRFCTRRYTPPTAIAGAHHLIWGVSMG